MQRQPWLSALSLVGLPLSLVASMVSVATLCNYRAANQQLENGGLNTILAEPTVTLYPAPKRIQVGQKFEPQKESERLDSLGYRNTTLGDPGTYQIGPDKLIVHSRLPELEGGTIAVHDGFVDSIVTPLGDPKEYIELEREPLATFLVATANGSDTIVPVDYVPRSFAYFHDSELLDCVLAREDEGFFSNPDLPTMSLVRAIFNGGAAGGAGGLAGQLVRTRLLNHVRTFSRKWAEIGLASALVNKLSREELAGIYFDRVPLGGADGRPIYGYTAAARVLFGASDIRGLTLAQSAVLAVLTSAPSSYEKAMRLEDDQDAEIASPLPAWRKYVPAFITRKLSPRKNLKPAEFLARLRRLRNELLEKLNRICPAKYSAARIESAKLEPIRVTRAPAVSEATKLSGHFIDYLLRQGLPLKAGRIHTTIEIDLQIAAVKSFRRHIEEMKNHLDAPNLNGSVIALEPDTLNLRVLVGGTNTAHGTFDRAIDAKRSAGSAQAKIFIFAWAVDHIYDRNISPLSVIDGANDPVEGDWRPRHHCGGKLTLFEHIAESSNCPPLVLGSEIGLNRVRSLYQDLLGVTPQRPTGMMVLGAEAGGEIPMISLAKAYSALANGGLLKEPRLYTMLALGRTILQLPDAPKPKRVFSQKGAFLGFQIMAAPLTGQGTASAAKVLMPDSDAVCKTGTGQVSDAANVCMLGSGKLLVLVHAGADDNQPLSIDDGFQGASLIPIAADIVRLSRVIHPEYFKGQLMVPSGLTSVQFDPVRGCAVANGGVFSYVDRGTEVRPCTVARPSPVPVRRGAHKK